MARLDWRISTLSDRINLYIVFTAVGKPDIIPTNIIIEIPLPIPFDVICSPNHIKSAVPATNDNTIIAPVPKPGFINTPRLEYAEL